MTKWKTISYICRIVQRENRKVREARELFISTNDFAVLNHPLVRYFHALSSHFPPHSFITFVFFVSENTNENKKMATRKTGVIVFEQKLADYKLRMKHWERPMKVPADAFSYNSSRLRSQLKKAEIIYLCNSFHSTILKQWIEMVFCSITMLLSLVFYSLHLQVRVCIAFIMC